MFNKMFDKYGFEAEKLSEERIEANKARVYELAGIDTAKKPRRFMKRAVIIPVAAVIIAAGTVTASAAGGIGALVDRLFGSPQSAYDILQSDIFHDEDGMVSVDIDEFMSDGVSVFLSLHYTALNSEGRAWLDSCDFQMEGIHRLTNHTFTLWPSSFMSGNYTFKGMFGSMCHEAEESRTENERYFLLGLDFSQKDTVGDKVRLYYPMPSATDRIRSTEIIIAERPKERKYVINAEPDSSKCYVPTCIRISTLSCTVYGNITRDGIITETSFNLPRGDYESLSASTYLVTKDGEPVYFGGAMVPVTPAEENNYSDIALYSGSYWSYDRPGGFFSGEAFMTVNIDDIAGIYIENVYYSFE